MRVGFNVACTLVVTQPHKVVFPCVVRGFEEDLNG